MTDVTKCQCPEDAIPSAFAYMMGVEKEEESVFAAGHSPGECPGTYRMRAYRRDGQILYLCSACFLLGDEVVV